MTDCPAVFALYIFIAVDAVAFYGSQVAFNLQILHIFYPPPYIVTGHT